jgi:hypothetical protein
MCRRFGWYMPRANAKFDLHSIDQPLTDQMWREFDHHVSIVEAIRPYVIDWLGLNADAAALAKLCDDDDVNAGDGSLRALPTLPLGIEQEAGAQRQVVHFLNAMAAFCSHASAGVREAFGEASAEVAAYDAAMDFWRKHSYAFGLVLDLRKFAEGHQLPFVFITLDDQSAGSDGPSEPRRSLLLLPSQTSVGGRVHKSTKANLSELLSEKMEVSRLIPECLTACGGLMLRILEFYSVQLRNLGHYTLELYEKLGIPRGAIAVVWEGPRDAPDPRSQTGATELRLDNVEMILALQARFRQGPVSPTE